VRSSASVDSRHETVFEIAVVEWAYLSRPNPPSRFADRVAYGLRLRDALRRVDQNALHTRRRGRDALGLLRAAEKGRVATLLPIKYGRMSLSPFAFFRGSATLMAADLATLPRTDYHVQICGDAHVRNLGAYASPDGRIVFDINDFDESMRAPWEWDLKRLATSFVLAGREARTSDRVCRDAVMLLVRSYRRAMARFAPMPAVELARYQVNRHLDEGPVHEVLRKAERASPLASLKKLTVQVRGGRRRFAQRPPLLTRVDPPTAKRVLASLAEYRGTLGPNRQLVLDAYCPSDVAFKVVGTGSVGTRDYVVLAFGNGASDPLILQVKEATRSCYAPYVKYVRGATAHQGRRVAEGQHRMQTVADPFLGWTTLGGADYLVRQLADHKASIDPEDLDGPTLADYALVCGEIFAKAHARTGDAAVLHGYAGDAEKLDRALAEFALLYADEATRDYETFKKAVAAGMIKAQVFER
jgi:uncharacterized protein (DUF2252 family)